MKARDIIPGWPRGRSTSKPLVSRWDQFLLFCPGVPGFEDWLENKIEERRKAVMMEAWYLQQQIDARGRLYPQPLSERMLESFLPWEVRINREVITYLQMFKENMETIAGAHRSIRRGDYPGGGNG